MALEPNEPRPFLPSFSPVLKKPFGTTRGNVRMLSASLMYLFNGSEGCSVSWWKDRHLGFSNLSDAV